LGCLAPHRPNNIHGKSPRALCSHSPALPLYSYSNHGIQNTHTVHSAARVTLSTQRPVRTVHVRLAPSPIFFFSYTSHQTICMLILAYSLLLLFFFERNPDPRLLAIYDHHTDTLPNDAFLQLNTKTYAVAEQNQRCSAPNDDKSFFLIFFSFLLTRCEDYDTVGDETTGNLSCGCVRMVSFCIRLDRRPAAGCFLVPVKNRDERRTRAPPPAPTP